MKYLNSFNESHEISNKFEQEFKRFESKVCDYIMEMIPNEGITFMELDELLSVKEEDDPNLPNISVNTDSAWLIYKIEKQGSSVRAYLLGADNNSFGIDNDEDDTIIIRDSEFVSITYINACISIADRIRNNDFK